MIKKGNSIVYDGLSFQSSFVFNLVMAMLFPSIKAVAKYDADIQGRHTPQD